MRRRRVVRRRGAGFFDVLKSAHDWIKKNKIISTVSGALSKVGVPYAGAINTASSALGYGRKSYRKRRVVRRRRVGGSLRSILSSAHGFVRKNQLASKLLNHLGHSKLASVASNLGYGRKLRVRKRRTVRHRGSGMDIRSMF